MTDGIAVAEPGRLRSAPAVLVVTWWLGLLFAGGLWAESLDAAWPAWRVARWAAAVWGLNALILYYLIGPPFALSRLPVVSAVFALLMTVFGSGSYWVTTQRFSHYFAFVERAALFVAVCTSLSVLGCLVSSRWAGPPRIERRGATWWWDWSRLRAVTYGIFVLCALGTFVSIRKIGYIPILTGDPESLRVEFPAIAGVWFRFSMLGIVVGLLAGAQVCARQASWVVWAVGLAGVACASLYGNRFFAALPVGATLVLWDAVRSRVRVRTVALGALVGVPALVLLYFWRQQNAAVQMLGPLALILYGILGEFRDLAWTLDYYSHGRALLHGSTLGGLFVPLLPSPIWSLLGVDKAAVFAYSNAAVLAREMDQSTAQRVGVYGELFMNFGYLGAFLGAVLYGLLLGYVDRHLATLRDGSAVRGIVLGVIAVVVAYAQVGQWNMLMSAITSVCYPILLVALVASRRTSAPS